MGARGFRSHLLVSGPAAATGVSPQVISRVSVGFVPAQAAAPVAVRVAVKEPFGTDGVKVAKAGSGFCIQVPSPAPPDYAKPAWVPVTDAPVIVMGARGVASHRERSAPASTSGGTLHDITLVSLTTGLPQSAVPVIVMFLLLFFFRLTFHSKYHCISSFFESHSSIAINQDFLFRFCSLSVRFSSVLFRVR